MSSREHSRDSLRVPVDGVRVRGVRAGEGQRQRLGAICAKHGAHSNSCVGVVAPELKADALVATRSRVGHVQLGGEGSKWGRMKGEERD